MAVIATLADLVAPLPEQEFLKILRGRTPKLTRGDGADRYGSLIGWDELIHIVSTGVYPAERLRMTQRGAPMPPVFYRDGNTPRASVIERVMASGGSIVAYGIDPYVPNLTRLCSSIAEQLGERVEGALVATTGPGGAIPLHYDKADVVALQIDGRKRWILQRDPVVDATAGMPTVPSVADIDPLLDVILEPGDFLFVPAGYRHSCLNAADRSLHASIFLWPMTAPRVLDLLFRQMVESAVDRKPLRADKQDEAAAEAALKQLLIEKIQALSLDELRTLHRQTDHSPAARAPAS